MNGLLLISPVSTCLSSRSVRLVMDSLVDTPRTLPSSCPCHSASIHLHASCRPLVTSNSSSYLVSSSRVNSLLPFVHFVTLSCLSPPHSALPPRSLAQVARDACGTPLRPFWPYVKDPPTISRLRNEQVFEVGACWNGIVAFPASLVVWRGEAPASASALGGGVDGAGMEAEMEDVRNETGLPGTMDRRITKRGWQMVDNGELFSLLWRGFWFWLRSRRGCVVVGRMGTLAGLLSVVRSAQ